MKLKPMNTDSSVKLVPFETYMESYEEELNRDELELFAEMTDSYDELADIIQEGKILDAATGKGKDENLLIKIIKFIPRFVKAVVGAIKNKINKNKNRIKELEDEVRKLKTDLDVADYKLKSANKKSDWFEDLSRNLEKKMFEQSGKAAEAEEKYEDLKAKSAKHEALIERLSKFETDFNPDKLSLIRKNLDILEKLPVNLNNKFTAFLKEVADTKTEDLAGIKEIFYKYFDKFNEKYDYKQDTQITVIDRLDAIFDDYNRYCDIIERLDEAVDDIHFDYDTLKSKGITEEQASSIRFIISDYFKELNAAWYLCNNLICINAPYINRRDLPEY